MADYRSDGHRPDSETLSAWLDGELPAAEQAAVAAHLADCAQCAAQLDALRRLAAGFLPMRAETLGYDLAGVIEGRLAEAAGRGRSAQRRRRARLAWLPLTLGAASLALGLGLGSALLGGAAGGSPPPTLVGAMRVFDPMPPGNLCLGAANCYTKGALR